MERGELSGIPGEAESNDASDSFTVRHQAGILVLITVAGAGRLTPLRSGFALSKCWLVGSGGHLGIVAYV